MFFAGSVRVRNTVTVSQTIGGVLLITIAYNGCVSIRASVARLELVWGPRVPSYAAGPVPHCVTTAASCDKSTCHVHGPPWLFADMPAHDASSVTWQAVARQRSNDAKQTWRKPITTLSACVTGQHSKRTRSKICALWHCVSLHKDWLKVLSD